MKILHVSQGYPPATGGTEKVMERVSEELARQFGDEVTVFTTTALNGQGFVNPFARRLEPGWEIKNGVKLLRLNAFPWLAPFLRPIQAFAYKYHLPFNQQLRTVYSGPIIPGLGRKIRNYPSDLIAASSFPLSHMYVALNAARSTRRPCILMGGLHPEDEWGFGRPMIYQAIARSDLYLAYTQYEADYVIEHGIMPEKVEVVGVGVDPGGFEAVSQDMAKARLGVSGKKFVGFIGQMAIHKGIEAFLKAMPLVWKKMPDTHFLIAGGQTNWSRHVDQILEKWSPEEKAKIIRRFNFPEVEKENLFGALDVFVYPSIYESFGIAFLEAWAAGIPVIGCRRGAIPSVVKDGEDGILIEKQDEYLLAEAILLLLQNPMLAKTLGQRGRQKVLNHYTWAQIARHFHEVYQHTLDARKG